MSFYRTILFPFLRRFDPEQVHELTLAALELAQSKPFGRFVLRQIAKPAPCQPVDLFGLRFPNVLGVAAGYDKEARVASGLALLGFGHVEVGTLTPYPQQGNPRPRIFRLPEDQALINRMGFPNQGVANAVPRLRRLAAQPRKFVLGVSLGKQKETALAQAVEDYLAAMRAVYLYADYLAVNVSSPNTPGLRELQGSRYLDRMLKRLMGEGRTLAGRYSIPERPLLLKIAPDLEWSDLDEIIQAALTHGVSGIIATNTSTGRPALVAACRQEPGGLSGRPLADRAVEITSYINDQVSDRLPVIGVGGIFDAAGARAQLDAGARLLQVYTGLVYRGPGIAGRILRALGG